MVSTGDERASEGRRPAIPPGKAHTGGKKGARKPSQLLKDLRFVYRTEDASKDTPSQKRLRKLADDNYDKFLSMLQAAERSHQTGGAKKAGADAPKPATPEQPADEGTSRAEDLIERLLDEFEAEERAEQERFLRDGCCATCGRPAIPGQGEAGRILQQQQQTEGRTRG